MDGDPVQVKRAGDQGAVDGIQSTKNRDGMATAWEDGMRWLDLCDAWSMYPIVDGFIQFPCLDLLFWDSWGVAALMDRTRLHAHSLVVQPIHLLHRTRCQVWM